MRAAGKIPFCSTFAKFVARATRFDNEAFVAGLRALIAEHGLQDRVSWLGEREDVPELMPSVTERESELPTEKLVSLLAVPVKSPNGANLPWWPRPRLRPAVLLTPAG